MRATFSENGIIRRIDDLGRIVIPKEIRREIKVDEGDPLEITLATAENGHKCVVISPYKTAVRAFTRYAANVVRAAYNDSLNINLTLFVEDDPVVNMGGQKRIPGTYDTGVALRCNLCSSNDVLDTQGDISSMYTHAVGLRRYGKIFCVFAGSSETELSADQKAFIEALARIIQQMIPEED